MQGLGTRLCPSIDRVLVTLALLLAPPLFADNLQPGDFEYLGYFQPPPNQGGGRTGNWSFGAGGLTLIPDCMGQPDPSPNDGFAGCIGAFGAINHRQFGVFDIVPPGEQAQQIVPFYEIGAPIVEEQIGHKGTVRYYDLLYDQGPDHCRIWWTYGDWFTLIAADPPFLGYSDCAPGTPNPQGLWDLGPRNGGRGDIQRDPFHTAKMYQGLSLIPRSIADAHFDGKQMMLGISRRDGGRGGSQGPSLYVRPLAAPSAPPPGPVMDATPLVWYLQTGYMEWWAEPQMDGPVVHWWATAKAFGAEFIQVDDREAVVLPWSEPIIDPADYPCSDQSAYRDDNPATPTPCKVPVCWYGVAACNNKAVHQQPSFWDKTKKGKSMPVDCEISDPCRESTGPHCLSRRPFLILYDLSELQLVYDGAKPHHYPQPYAKIPLADKWMAGQECGSGSSGSTTDHANNRLFISQSGRRPVVHVFEIASRRAAFE